MTNDQFNTILQVLAQQGNRLEAAITDMNKRFKESDKRFGKIDKRFEKIDKRFEKVDKRFEEMDKKMTEGFARQEALSQEILKIIGREYSNLESSHIKTKKSHENRLTKLEAAVFRS